MSIFTADACLRFAVEYEPKKCHTDQANTKNDHDRPGSDGQAAQAGIDNYLRELHFELSSPSAAAQSREPFAASPRPAELTVHMSDPDLINKNFRMRPAG